MNNLKQILMDGPLEELRAQMVDFLKRAKTEENQAKILIDLVNYVSSFQDENLTKIVRMINGLNILKKLKNKKEIIKKITQLREMVEILGRDNRKKDGNNWFVYNTNDNYTFENINLYIKTSEMTTPEEINSKLNDQEITEIKEFIIKSAEEVLGAVCNLRIAVNGK